MAASMPIEPAPTNKRTQTCDHHDSYYTASDWELLNSQLLSLTAKVGVLAKSWYKIGLTCPSEAQLKRGGALLLFVQRDDSLLTPVMKRKVCRDLQDAIQGWDDQIGEPQHGRIVRYPEDPSRLPQLVFTAAYDAEPPIPPPREFVEQRTRMCLSMVIRKTAKGVACNTTQWSVAHIANSAPDVLSSVAQPLVNLMVPFLLRP